MYRTWEMSLSRQVRGGWVRTMWPRLLALLRPCRTSRLRILQTSGPSICFASETSPPAAWSELAVCDL